MTVEPLDDPHAPKTQCEWDVTGDTDAFVNLSVFTAAPGQSAKAGFKQLTKKCPEGFRNVESADPPGKPFEFCAGATDDVVWVSGNRMFVVLINADLGVPMPSNDDVLAAMRAVVNGSD